jgi:predicted metal-binding protein
MTRVARTPQSKRKRPSVQALASKALELGAIAAKVINTSSVVTAAWVRLKCQYGCGGFNSSLCCPPHTPTPEETRRFIDCYDKAILFEAGRREPKKIAVQLEREVFLAGYYKAFGLGSGPCRYCGDKPCALDKGCRHPMEARPSMEACGIDVFATVRSNGFEIEVVKDRQDSQHYFGLVLVE